MGKNSGKLIIFSAPSGAGKTTIVRSLLKEGLNLRFSVSATTRPRRDGEKHGREYYFLPKKLFQRHIDNGDFIEYEEVYEGHLYGTLKHEVDYLLETGANVVFDIDVMGGLNIKKIYQEMALAIFVMPPDLEVLKQRLKKRGTENETSLAKRLEKAEWELKFAAMFDRVVINGDLNTAMAEVKSIVKSFINDE